MGPSEIRGRVDQSGLCEEGVMVGFDKQTQEIIEKHKAGWGRLKSGAGWISLDYARRV